jgi:hypothetical protein
VVLLTWFLAIAAISILAVRTEAAEARSLTRAEIVGAAIFAATAAAGWILRPAQYDATLRVAAPSLAILLSSYSLVILQRAARVYLPDPVLRRLITAVIVFTVLRSLATPNPNGWAAERLRTMPFDIAPLRMYILPLLTEASLVAAGGFMFLRAIQQRRLVWLVGAVGFVLGGAVGVLNVLHLLSDSPGVRPLAMSRAVLYAAVAVLLIALAARQHDRDIIIPAAGQDTA